MNISEKEIVKEMLPVELKSLLDRGSNIQMIDVREPYEHEATDIGGELIPLNEVLSNISGLATDRPVVFYCKVGLRSHIAILRLQEKYDFKNLYNLKGGITAYLKQ